MEGLFHKIEQVAFVVPDLKAAIKILTDELGIDPVIKVDFGYKEGDEVFNQNAASIEQVYLDGKYIGNYAIKLGVCDMKNGTQIELIEPLGNPSIFQQYLEEHGPGCQHIAVDNSGRFTEMIGRMGAAGNPLGQVALVDGQEDCAFVKHTYSLGTALELHQRGPDWIPPSGQPPMEHANRDKRPEPLTDMITSICLATEDFERMLELLEKKYGIGPWEKSEQDGLKLAVCASLNMKLEIISPMYRSHPVAVWLKENHGPGIHHVGFNCLGDLEEIMELLRADGRSIIYENEAHETALVDYTELLGVYLKFCRNS